MFALSNIVFIVGLVLISSILTPYITGEVILPLEGKAISLLVLKASAVLLATIHLLRYMLSSINVTHAPSLSTFISEWLILAAIGVSFAEFFDPFLSLYNESPAIIVTLFSIGLIAYMSLAFLYVQAYSTTYVASPQSRLMTPGISEALNDGRYGEPDSAIQLRELISTLTTINDGDDLIDAKIKKLLNFPLSAQFTQDSEAAKLLLPYRFHGLKSSLEWTVRRNKRDNKGVNMTLLSIYEPHNKYETSATAKTEALAIVTCVLKRELAPIEFTKKSN